MADTDAAPVTGAEEPPGSTGGEQDAPPATGDQSSDIEALKEALSKVRKDLRESEKTRKAAEGRVQEFEDASKSELDKLTEENAALKEELGGTQTALSRFQVAAEKKLPGELVELLSGTKDEMAARADVLLQHISQNAPAPEFGGGPRTPAAEPKPADQAHNDLILGLTGHLPPPDDQ